METAQCDAKKIHTFAACSNSPCPSACSVVAMTKISNYLLPTCYLLPIICYLLSSRRVIESRSRFRCALVDRDDSPCTKRVGNRSKLAKTKRLPLTRTHIECSFRTRARTRARARARAYLDAPSVAITTMNVIVDHERRVAVVALACVSTLYIRIVPLVMQLAPTTVAVAATTPAPAQARARARAQRWWR